MSALVVCPTHFCISESPKLYASIRATKRRNIEGVQWWGLGLLYGVARLYRGQTQMHPPLPLPLSLC